MISHGSVRTRAGALGAAAGMALLAAPLVVGCGSGAGSAATATSGATLGSTASTSTASSSTASSSTASSSTGNSSTVSTGATSGAAASGTFSGMTASQIAAKANADLKAATSFHAVGTLTAGGVTEKLDITSSGGDCSAAITVGGSATGLVVVGKTMWVKAAGEYLKTTTGNDQYAQSVSLCESSQLAGMFGLTTDLSEGPLTAVDGQKVLQLKEGGAESIYVTDAATPEYVRLDIPGMEMEISGVNTPVTISAPPSSEVLP
jgi:hypothetical protein